MLVRQKEHALAALKSPAHDGGGIRAGANRAAVLAGKRFNGGGGVHISDGHDLQITEFTELVPAGFDLADVGHVGHRATGVQVRQDYLLMGPAKDIGAFGHEVDAAKDDVAGVRGSGLLGKFEGIAAEIGEFDDFVALVMMAEDHHIAAQTGLGRGDAVIESIVRREQVAVEIASDARFDFRGTNRRGLGRAGQRGEFRNGD